MPKACELKKGMIVGIRKLPYELETLSVTTPSARGAASIYHFRFRNLVDATKQDVSCHGDELFADIDLDSRPVQYLYQKDDVYSFMDTETYEQFDLLRNQIEQQLPFLVEDMEGLSALLTDGKVIAIKLPQKVKLTILHTDPVLKGASVTARGKTAECQTGLKLNVPEYLEEGEEILIDSATGEYLQRANAINRS